MRTRLSWRGTIVASAGALVVATLASGAFGAAAVAQVSTNPSDVLAPDEPQGFNFSFRPSGDAGSNNWSLADTPSVDLTSVGKWRFTLDLNNDATVGKLQLQDFRAGAFFDLSPRMSVGTAFSFSNEDKAIARVTGGQVDQDVPEVKFESAFKF